MKKNLHQIINKNTVAWSEFTTDFTVVDQKTVEAEVKYYDVLQSLKSVRQKLGLTQAQLAKKADIPRTTVTKVESGKYNPTINTLMSIASAMGKRIVVSLL